MPPLVISQPMNLSSPSEITAVITAGGQSSRFGSDKALARLNGQTLLWHVAQSLQAYERRLLIAPVGKYDLPDWEVIPDTRPGEGPLAGLETALLHATTDWVAFVGVDMPCLPSQYWETLAEKLTTDALAVKAVVDGNPQPLAALYRRTLLARITSLLDRGERRLRLAAPSEQTVLVQDLPDQWLRNINRPADLMGL